jgi:hypothetical protein
VKIFKRRPIAETLRQVDAADTEQLQQTVVAQAMLLQRNAAEIELWRNTAKRLGTELERVIEQPEGSDEHLAATWWRDQYAALTEQVQQHLESYHPGVAAL